MQTPGHLKHSIYQLCETSTDLKVFFLCIYSSSSQWYLDEEGCEFLGHGSNLENVILNSSQSALNFSKPQMLDNFTVSAFIKLQLTLAVR